DDRARRGATGAARRVARRLARAARRAGAGAGRAGQVGALADRVVELDLLDLGADELDGLRAARDRVAARGPDALVRRLVGLFAGHSGAVDGQLDRDRLGVGALVTRAVGAAVVDVDRLAGELVLVAAEGALVGLLADVQVELLLDARVEDDRLRVAEGRRV